MSEPFCSSDTAALPWAPAPARDPSASGRIWRILVVEDVPSLQRLLVLMLQKAGHTVLTANNGLDAIELVAREDLDAILMDIQMPGMDGLEATRAIRHREMGTNRHLPIITVTAHALTGDAAVCHAAGADEYLRKPINLDELMRMLSRLIG